MDFLELVKKRHSVRGYTDTPIEEEKIHYIFEAVRYAPSACNFQPWVFIVVRSDEARQALNMVYPRQWFIEAPVVIAACCDRSMSWKRADGKDYGEVDVAIALDHLTLAAAEQGLGTCWIGAFKADEASRVLKLPSHIEPIAFTPLGYPASSDYEKKTRKNSASLIYWDFFDE